MREAVRRGQSDEVRLERKRILLEGSGGDKTTSKAIAVPGIYQDYRTGPYMTETRNGLWNVEIPESWLFGAWSVERFEAQCARMVPMVR